MPSIIVMDALRRADLPLLLSLDTLLTERSVTKAAVRLGLSQPALSAQLARLRDLFGDPLLVQSGKRMVPTARAEELAEPLHRLVGELGSLVRDAQTFDPASSTRTFRIAATDFVHATLLLNALEVLRSAAPGVRIALVQFEPKRAWSMLEDDEVDVLVVSERLTPQAATARTLFNERFVLITRQDHPLQAAPIDLDAFCAASHILVSPQGGGFFGASDEALAQLGRTRHVAVSVPSFLLAIPLVLASDYVAIVPERLARGVNGLAVAEPPMPITGFPILSSWHPRRSRDPGHRWLRELLAAQCPDV